MKHPHILRALSLVGALFASSAWAQIEAVSNLAEARIGGSEVTPTVLEAGQFTTGPSIGGLVNLDSVVIKVGSPTTPGTGFGLSLFSDTAGLPGSAITTLSGPDPAGVNFVDYTFSAPPGTLLAANTSYWLVASAASGAFQWSVTASGTQVGLTGWSISNDHFANIGGGWIQTPNLATMFAVNITPVPEPSTYAAGLLLVGAVGGAWWRQRRSR